MQDSFKSIIGPAKSILVILPTEPTFDEVASGLALYLALSQENGEKKEINVHTPSAMTVEFNRLVGVNKIKKEIGNKNLVISFLDYDSRGIEKISYDIDERGQVNLVVAPKANVAPPAQEQIKANYMGVVADLAILIGGKSEESFPAVKNEDLKNSKLAYIGIMDMKISGRDVSSFATTGSSISEVTANIIRASGYKMDADIATDLLMGIENTTKGFMERATAETFALISELMKAGGKRLSDGRVEASQFPAGAIPGMAMPGAVPSSWTQQPKIFKGTSNS